ncbi:unnamed protein product [Sphagnum troendelagicum]|uniref:Nucleotide-diphospho-sugar transferase domain-containing protein n=1 Tax=Sphagnum troendelagicum TaxID=128251 RepID=A0ABP0V352_9BRYO
MLRELHEYNCSQGTMAKKIIVVVLVAALLGVPYLISLHKPTVLLLTNHFNYLVSSRHEDHQIPTAAAPDLYVTASTRPPEADPQQQQQLQAPQQEPAGTDLVEQRNSPTPAPGQIGVTRVEAPAAGDDVKIVDQQQPVLTPAPGGQQAANTSNPPEEILAAQQPAESPKVQQQQQQQQVLESQIIAGQELQQDEWKVLEDLLVKASMGNNKTVIITSLNQAWAAPAANKNHNMSMFSLFLEGFRNGEGTQHLLDHLIVVALDNKAYNSCMQESHRLHCFKLKSTEGVDFSPDQVFMSTDYVKMVWKRFEYLGHVLSLGYNFIFTDVDILWFRDPFLHFDASKDFQIAADIYAGTPDSPKNSANAGFYFAHSNKRTLAFFHYWNATHYQHRAPRNEQDAFNIIVKEQGFLDIGLKYNFLDARYFSSFCHMNDDMRKVVTLHGNCCVGQQRKLDDLRLCLNDWASYKALSTQQKLSDKRIALWRAPKNCKSRKRSKP